MGCYEVSADGVVLHYYGGYPRGEHVRQPLPGADPGSFRHLGGPEPGTCQAGHVFGADASKVFYRTSVVKGADPRSFRVLGQGYSADSSKVFYRDAAVVGVSVAAFRAIMDTAGNDFATDGRTLFRRGVFVEADLDPATFEALHSPFCKDAARVYLLGSFRPVPGADPATFVVHPQPDQPATNASWANDRLRAYRFEDGEITVIEGIDAATFAPLNRSYAKDARRVYFEGAAIEGADPASFGLEGGSLSKNARDRSRRYREGRPID